MMLGWSEPPRIVTSVEDPPRKLVPFTESLPLYAWMSLHAGHGHAGPWFDAKVHVYNTWHCSCSERWQCTDDEREAYPERCTERGR